jgi:hypothetical protein
MSRLSASGLLVEVEVKVLLYYIEMGLGYQHGTVPG